MENRYFVGRKTEIYALQTRNWRAKSQLIVVYGRRRVGKTSLIQEAFKNENIWNFDGIEGVSQREQLSHFASQLSYYCQDPQIKKKIKTWEDAFLELYHQLKGKECTVFFDEFQWLAGMRSQLVAYFKSAWDRNLSSLSLCRFVLCGSISSFMVKKVLKSKAMYGRIDTEIDLGPLSLREAFDFFKGKRNKFETLEIAMTFGCIPQYLLEMNPKYTFIQNLNEYAFSRNGYFVNEYQRLFISHFGKNIVFQKILEQLAQNSLSLGEISKKLKISSGGTLTSVLEELEWAGFIERYSSLNRDESGRYPRYRILDEYLHFYFKFIMPHMDEIRSKGSFSYSQVSATKMFEQWQGYAFERLCRRNSFSIADHLRFSGVKYKSGSWFTTGRSSVDLKKGAQIDLIFERDDRVITVCECKWINQMTGSKLIENFKNKVERAQIDYPGYGFEKVLILGKKIPIPEKVASYFDHILFAEDIFFD